MRKQLQFTDQTSLAVDAAGFAKLINVSLRHLNALNSSGRVPRPIRFGRSVRWSISEIEAWLDAGAPSRDVWETMKSAANE